MSPRVALSSEGLALEAELDAPEAAEAALVLCHPHPHMGGTMHAPLLLALRDDLVERGWAVLRFNYRGVGGSEGASTEGDAEVGDASSAVARLRELVPHVPVALVGWSFGGAVAVRAAERDDSLLACVGIAPSVTPKTGVSAGLPPAEELDLGLPLLFVCGANDVVVAPADCRRWVEGVPAGSYVEIPGANHFFWARYERLIGTVGGWLDERRTSDRVTRG